MKHWTLTRVAELDLDQAHNYLCENASLEKAANLREQIEAACNGLAEMPHKGEHREDWTDRSVRFWLVDPYWIIYQVNSDRVEVLRILHSARDVPGLL